MWKTVKGYPNYEVSSSGSIRNKKTKKVLSPKTRWDGYKEVVLMKDGTRNYKKIHKIVASTFKIGGKGDIVNHKNSNRGDNRASNLNKTTSSENNKKKNKKKTSKTYQNRSNEAAWKSKGSKTKKKGGK